MPAHISPALSARQVALAPRRPYFLLHAARETGREEGEEEGDTVAKACQPTCPTLTSLSELKRTLLNATIPFRPPPWTPRSPSSIHPIPPSATPHFSDISAVSAIYLVRLARNARMLVRWTCTRVRAYTCIREHIRTIYMGVQTLRERHFHSNMRSSIDIYAAILP